MESWQQRKSWFCSNPTLVQLSPNPCPLSKSELLVSSDENVKPITIEAADVLLLTTFSRRAQIDFGTVRYNERPFVAYLLLENPHDHKQCVRILRGLPEDEFVIDWILPDPEVQHVHPLTGSAIIEGGGGRCLLRITWTPAEHQNQFGPHTAPIDRSVHHVIQFRISDSYPLQASVVGRVCYELPGKSDRTKTVFRHPLTASRSVKLPTSQRSMSHDRAIGFSRSEFRSGFPLRPDAQTMTNRTLPLRTFNSTELNSSVHPKPELLTSPHASAVMPDWASRALCSQEWTSRPYDYPRRASSCSRILSNTSSTDLERTLTPSHLKTPDTKSHLNASSFISPALIHSPSLGGAGPQSSANVITGVPFTNIFYTDVTGTLDEYSERGLTQWLNTVFSPSVAANESAYPNSAEYQSVYEAALDRAKQILCSPMIVSSGQRVEKEVDEGKITPVSEVVFKLDKGAQQHLIDLILLNYSTAWIRVAIDALADSKSREPKQTNPDQLGSALSQKLRAYFFAWSQMARPKTNASGPKVKQSKVAAISNRARSAPNRDVLQSRHVVKRFITLVWFLDLLKVNRILDHDPCLFRSKSRIKSSSDLLLTFSRTFLTGENNLVRHLVNLGVRVEVVQSGLDEFPFTVTNLAFDLRDGIRLVKLAEILIPSMPKTASKNKKDPINTENLMSLVRFPAISRLQKIHNVGVAIKAFAQYGQLCTADGTRIDPRDIVDGHQEKTFTLLWCLLLRYQILALIDLSLLKEEIGRLEAQVQSNSPSAKFEGDEVHVSLLLWAHHVCERYDVEVANLDQSFSDGRAFCFLLHHYLPTVMPRGSIRPISKDHSKVHLLRNSRFNLQLFQRKLSFLGDVPMLLDSSSVEGTSLLPPGLVLATLAYLASRLVLSPDKRTVLTSLLEDHAARILQAAWRRKRRIRETTHLRLLSSHQFIDHDSANTASPAMMEFFRSRRSQLSIPPAFPGIVRLQAMVRGFLARRCVFRMRVTQKRAAVVIQRAWRHHLTRRAELSHVQNLALLLQRHSRGYLARYRTLQLIEQQHLRARAVTMLQARWRGYLARAHMTKQRIAATRIQGRWRARTDRLRWVRTQQAVLCIQKYWRGYLARRQCSKLRREKEIHLNLAARTIQAWWRGQRVHRKYIQVRSACIQIQRWWVGVLQHREQVQAAVVLQKYCRRFLARQHLFHRRQAWLLRREAAAIVIQSYWRGHVVRQHLRQIHQAALRIQCWWRMIIVRRERAKMIEAIVCIQRYCRVHFAQQQYTLHRRAVYLQRHTAAARIQALWRGWTVRKRLRLASKAAVQIQCWWRMVLAVQRKNCVIQTVICIQAYSRGFLAREHYNSRKQARLSKQHQAARRIQSWWRMVLTMRQMYQASITIQRYWRQYRIKHFLFRRRRAAITIQAVWRGYRVRRAVEQCIVNVRVPTNRKQTAPKRGPPKSTFVLSLDTKKAKRLFEARKKLVVATRAAARGTHRILATRANVAVNYLINSKSFTQVLHAIKELEFLTHLSFEICSWCVGFLPVSSLRPRLVTIEPIQTGQSPQLHLVFLNLIQLCNRSVPHEELLLSVTGALLNIARHRLLAAQFDLWWNSCQHEDDAWEVVASALFARAQSGLHRTQSLCSLSVSVSQLEVNHLNRCGDDSLLNEFGPDDEGRLVSAGSVAEALVGILLRTWRGRPGTLTLRLFTRVCCLLGVLSSAIPSAHVLPSSSSLLPVCRQLCDCLHRRTNPNPSTSSMWTNETVQHSDYLVGLSKSRQIQLLSQLRSQLRHELDWNLHPVKGRPDAVAAIDFLLLTIILNAD